jgi:hypothetical protein
MGVAWVLNGLPGARMVGSEGRALRTRSWGMLERMSPVGILQTHSMTTEPSWNGAPARYFVPDFPQLAEMPGRGLRDT